MRDREKMFAGKGKTEKNNNNGVVAVAIDKDRASQHALKWAIDNLLSRAQTIILVHVKLNQFLPPSRHHQISDIAEEYADRQFDPQTKELFLPFRCFCTRKDIQCKDFIIEDVDVVKGLVECVNQAAIEHLVIGLSTKNGFLRRFKEKDIPGNASKMVPDFCTVYVISKGKLASTRSAIRPAPSISPMCNQIMSSASFTSSGKRTAMKPQCSFPDPTESMRSPLTRERGYTGKSYGEFSVPETDISFVCSERPSVDRLFPSFYDNTEVAKSPRFSTGSDRYYFGDGTIHYGRQSIDVNSPTAYSSISHESERSPWSSQSTNDVEAEMRRLKLELKQTMEMYSSACREALTAKQKARELQRWKFEEERKLEEAKMAEEAAIAMAEREKAKSRAAIEAADAAHKIAELEAQKRKNAEMKALGEAEEKRRALDALAQTDVRYRKYSIEEIEYATDYFAESRKIGEGGYGPVYKCFLDHTPVAIKVLRPDAAQGRSQFQQEVEVLSCIRHPNMVLLLGACPEYGCLVYEYMANGSLDDRLFCRGNTPPLSWQLRFKLAAEIGTGLLFLHQAKPEPLVHRDLKPGNILLDRNFVSKISDVGLSRLVPPSVADTVTQYRMTSTAGTFCYIDPEYQQTGMLGIKSDIYSLGIMFLQLITAKPPMGLSHHVSRAIENGTFSEFLDPSVPDWPIEEAFSFAKMALRCAELRRKDRPDLGKVVLPELNRLRTLAEDDINHAMSVGSAGPSPRYSQVSARQEVLSDYQPPQSETSSRESPTSPCR